MVLLVPISLRRAKFLPEFMIFTLPIIIAKKLGVRAVWFLSFCRHFGFLLLLLLDVRKKYYRDSTSVRLIYTYKQYC